MISLREEAQKNVGEVSEILLLLMFDILAENYVNGKSSTGVNHYRQFVDDKCRSTQFKLGPAKDASTIKSIYEEYCQEVLR